MSGSRCESDLMTPRESYSVFPAWTAWFWTWLTGAATVGEPVPLRRSPWTFLVAALASYLGGIGLAIAGAGETGAWAMTLLAAGWCLTVSGARRLVSTVVHQCIHGRFSGQRRLDQLLGELVTVLTFTQTAAAYRREHFEQHHRFGVFATGQDPAAQFMARIGFRPGLSVRRLWAQLCINLVSPLFHWRFFAQRALSNFITASPGRMAAAYVHGLAWGAAIALGWLDCQAVLLGFVVPVVVLYQTSVMLEFVSEHAWFVPTPNVAHARDVHRTHSWARFCGATTPARASASAMTYAGHWIAWSFAHALYHLPVRLMVLPGDLPQHDFHHRSPNTPDWQTAASARRRYLSEANEEALEFWGLHRAIHHVFTGLASAPALQTAVTDARSPLEENEV